MRQHILDHALSILFVFVVFSIFMFIEQSYDETPTLGESSEFWLQQKTLDFSNPLHKSLFNESLNLFYQHNRAANDSLLNSIDSHRINRMKLSLETQRLKRGLSWEFSLDLLRMYISFIGIFIFVLFASYYATQVFAIISFIFYKQQASSFLKLFFQSIKSLGSELKNGTLHWRKILEILFLLVKIFSTGLFYLILFAPAYVVAYSFKSSFESGGYVFMIILGIFSNGILINYAYKFYTFLMHESRKGYVETSIVKGLKSSYKWNVYDGIPFRSIFHIRKTFPGHILHHIYTNAHYQYIPTLKHYASFLITGLVIIEMALNIQGHLCYELLQSILFKQYDVTLVIIFGIFLIVKTTEICVDLWYDHESRKYENS